MNRAFNGVVAAVLIGSFGLAACGNDATVATKAASKADPKVVKEYVDAMKEGSNEDFPVSDADLECWMGGVVGGIGEDRLKEVGMTPESVNGSGDDNILEKLTKKERTVFAASFRECIDLKEVFMASLDQQAAESGEEVPEKVRECFSDALSGDEIEEAFAEAIISGDEDSMSEDSIMAPLAKCFTESMDLGSMDSGSETTSEPPTTEG